MSKSGLLARQKAERELWTIKVIAYTEQQTLDAVCLALAEGFGFGEERLKRFHDAFNAKYAEIQASLRSATPRITSTPSPNRRPHSRRPVVSTIRLARCGMILRSSRETVSSTSCDKEEVNNALPVQARNHPSPQRSD